MEVATFGYLSQLVQQKSPLIDFNSYHHSHHHQAQNNYAHNNNNHATKNITFQMDYHPQHQPRRNVSCKYNQIVGNCLFFSLSQVLGLTMKMGYDPKNNDPYMFMSQFGAVYLNPNFVLAHSNSKKILDHHWQNLILSLIRFLNDS